MVKRRALMQKITRLKDLITYFSKYNKLNIITYFSKRIKETRLPLLKILKGSYSYLRFNFEKSNNNCLFVENDLIDFFSNDIGILIYCDSDYEASSYCCYFSGKLDENDIAYNLVNFLADVSKKDSIRDNKFIYERIKEFINNLNNFEVVCFNIHNISYTFSLGVITKDKNNNSSLVLREVIKNYVIPEIFISIFSDSENIKNEIIKLCENKLFNIINRYYRFVRQYIDLHDFTVINIILVPYKSLKELLSNIFRVVFNYLYTVDSTIMRIPLFNVEIIQDDYEHYYNYYFNDFYNNYLKDLYRSLGNLFL